MEKNALNKMQTVSRVFSGKVAAASGWVGKRDQNIRTQLLNKTKASLAKQEVQIAKDAIAPKPDSLLFRT